MGAKYALFVAKHGSGFMCSSDYLEVDNPGLVNRGKGALPGLAFPP